MRRLRRNRRKPVKTSPLRMTSMMDILTVLLLFLLKSFVVEGETVTPAAGVELPESTSDLNPEASVVIAIADDRILIENEVVAVVEPSGAGGSLLIPSLASRLEDTRKRSEVLAAKRGENDDFAGHITIQGDRDMPFQLLQKVMYTCNQSGYDHISLAVIQTTT